MQTLIKKDIARMVSEKTILKIDRVATIVDGVFKTLAEILSEADPEVRIEIRGFGVLGVKQAQSPKRVIPVPMK